MALSVTLLSSSCQMFFEKFKAERNHNDFAQPVRIQFALLGRFTICPCDCVAYGWPGSVYRITDGYLGVTADADADEIDPDMAYEKIAERILEMAPGASTAEINALIMGQGI